MKKPTIEVKCDMTTGTTLVFQHTPGGTNDDVVWARAEDLDGRVIPIRMSCERALALGKALVETYGNENPKKITI